MYENMPTSLPDVSTSTFALMRDASSTSNAPTISDVVRYLAKMAALALAYSLTSDIAYSFSNCVNATVATTKSSCRKNEFEPVGSWTRFGAPRDPSGPTIASARACFEPGLVNRGRFPHAVQASDQDDPGPVPVVLRLLRGGVD